VLPSAGPFDTGNVAGVTLEPDLSQIGFELGNVCRDTDIGSSQENVCLLHYVRLHDGVDEVSLFLELGGSQSLLDCGIQVVVVEEINGSFVGWTAKD